MRKKEYQAIQKLIRISGWQKSGGYARAKEAQIQKLLKEAGFRRQKAGAGKSTPDGSMISGADYYVHPLGLVAKWYERIGSTKWDNYYGFTVSFKRDGGYE